MHSGQLKRPRWGLQVRSGMAQGRCFTSTGIFSVHRIYVMPVGTPELLREAAEFHELEERNLWLAISTLLGRRSATASGRATEYQRLLRCLRPRSPWTA